MPFLNIAADIFLGAAAGFLAYFYTTLFYFLGSDFLVFLFSLRLSLASAALNNWQAPLHKSR